MSDTTLINDVSINGEGLTPDALSETLKDNTINALGVDASSRTIWVNGQPYGNAYVNIKADNTLEAPIGAEIFNDFEHNVASGEYSHAHGYYTETTNTAEAAFGKYNESTEGSTIFSIGDGDSDDSRHNIVEVTVDGVTINTNLNVEDNLEVNGATHFQSKPTVTNGTIAEDPVVLDSELESTKEFLDDKIVIIPGDYPSSGVLRGEYEGYSNKAISQTSMAVGAATTAGLKGWYYTHVNIDEKKLFLGYERTQVLGVDSLTCTYDSVLGRYPDSKYTDESFVSGYEFGDVISIVYDRKFEDYATITAVNGNVITLDKVPFVSDDFKLGVCTKVTTIGQPDEFSVYCIKRDFNDTTKVLNVSKHDVGGVDFGGGAFAEGAQTYAVNIGAHAEGAQTVAKGQYSHVEGLRTQANYAAHAEGVYTEAIGRNSHAEGNRSKSIGDDSHAEGDRTESHGAQSHTEGTLTKSFGYNAHAEGESTIAIGNTSHSEGRYTVANNTGAHAEGRYSIANGLGAHAEGGQDSNSNAELKLTSVSGNDKQYTYSSGYPYMYTACYVELDGVHVIAQITAIDTTNKTITLDKTIGNLSNVTVRFAGYAGGVCSHSEGAWSVAVKNSAHAEGYATYASAQASHAEGRETIASNNGSHAEGRITTSSGDSSHSEGYRTTASGAASHAEGWENVAGGEASHAEGCNTKTSNSFEHAEGKYNVSNTNTIHSVGIGTSSKRKNAHEILSTGEHYILNVGGYDGTNPDTSSDIATYLPNMVNIEYAELAELKRDGKLVPGQQYRITDYVTTTSQIDTDSAGHQFDIIVTADDINVLNENARAIQHEEDTYFSNSDLNAWEVKYCLDNDTERFAWADTNNGKGVIYYMKDEWNNECPYDFKNIQFKHPNGSTTHPDYYYTFSTVISGTVTDHSFTQGYCRNNTMKEYISSRKQYLNNNVFLNTSNTNYCHDNSFGNNCHDNSFENRCYYNSFGNNCHGNSFGNICYGNSFGSSCYGNSFENSCSSNSFGSSCYGNSFENNCYDNSFGNNCHDNSFGYGCSNNSFGTGCSNNSFGTGCSSNSFGNDCHDNSFGESSSNLKSYYRNIIFDNGNSYINLNCTSTTGSSKYFQNVRIGLGVNNTTTKKTISDSNVGQTYETYYKPANSQTITL